MSIKHIQKEKIKCSHFDFLIFINNNQFPTKEHYIVAKSPRSAFPPCCPFKVFTGVRTLNTIAHLSGPLRHLSLATQNTRTLQHSQVFS